MTKRPLIFGEVLFDVFPDGRAVLGGAPFNVAWHLHGLGCAPLMVSRIGRDERGAQIVDRMTDWGMDAAGMQTDEAHATGAVEVSFHNGQPAYEIVTERAYDFIAWPPLAACLADRPPALLYHGSLIARSPVSHQTLLTLRKTIDAPLFLDVNLRRPWWTREGIDELMHAAAWIKMNDEELALLQPEPADPLAAAHALCTRCRAQATIVTQGARGATIVFADGQTLHAAAPPVTNLVDTVGAGDAFSAVMLAGIVNDLPWDESLRRAVQFAAKICAMRGATTTDRSLYVD